jgi:uridylate kinase
MTIKKRILLKLTGEIFLTPSTHELSADPINRVIEQILQLKETHQFALVIGGGNFFRGSKQGAELGITPAIGHHIGMLATIMNGLIVKDLLEQHAVKATLLCAIPTPGIGLATSQQEIDSALRSDALLIFAGGTGNPFFTTDTNAVLRGLQINAVEIWKGTTVDGVYDADPRVAHNARLLRTITYKEALDNKLAIMDATAFALAEQYHQKIRVFNIFTDNALIHAARDEHFGSIIQ